MRELDFEVIDAGRIPTGFTSRSLIEVGFQVFAWLCAAFISFWIPNVISHDVGVHGLYSASLCTRV